MAGRHLHCVISLYLCSCALLLALATGERGKGAGHSAVLPALKPACYQVRSCTGSLFKDRFSLLSYRANTKLRHSQTVTFSRLAMIWHQPYMERPLIILQYIEVLALVFYMGVTYLERPLYAGSSIHHCYILLQNVPIVSQATPPRLLLHRSRQTKPTSE